MAAQVRQSHPLLDAWRVQGNKQLQRHTFRGRVLIQADTLRSMINTNSEGRLAVQPPHPAPGKAIQLLLQRSCCMSTPYPKMCAGVKFLAFATVMVPFIGTLAIAVPNSYFVPMHPCFETTYQPGSAIDVVGLKRPAASLTFERIEHSNAFQGQIAKAEVAVTLSNFILLYPSS